MTEKHLEDYAVAHIDDVFACVDKDMRVTIIGQQVPCRHGIIDLLAYYRGQLLVIEFKAVQADDKVAGQLERYKRAIQFLTVPDFITLDIMRSYPNLFDNMIATVAIAPSFTTQALRAVDHCILSSRSGNEYTFEKAPYTREPKGTNDKLKEVLRPFYRDRLNWEMEYKKKHNDQILQWSAEQRLKDVN
jgi:Holliday junction resolvase-like predicted endonuclease